MRNISVGEGQYVLGGPGPPIRKPYWWTSSTTPEASRTVGADPTDNQDFYRFVQVLYPVMIGQRLMRQWSRHEGPACMLLGLITSCDWLRSQNAVRTRRCLSNHRKERSEL